MRAMHRSQKSENGSQKQILQLFHPFLTAPFYWLSLFFFALGLMGKSMLVTLPFVLLLLDFWPLQRFRVPGSGSRVQSLLIEKLPFFLLVIPVSMVGYLAQKEGGQFLLRFPMSFRLETALMGYARYLGKMFWPADFSVLYPYPDFWPVGELLFASALILGISALAFVLRRQRPYLLAGWLWYVGTLVPVIGLIPLGAQSMSNRYTYLPMIGTCWRWFGRLLILRNSGDSELPS